MAISVNYGFGGSVMTVTNAKSSAESEKFTLKIRSESGKLFTIGCHFQPKLTNFGTMIGRRNRHTDRAEGVNGARWMIVVGVTYHEREQTDVDSRSICTFQTDNIPLFVCLFFLGVQV